MTYILIVSLYFMFVSLVNGVHTLTSYCTISSNVVVVLFGSIIMYSGRQYQQNAI